MRATPILAATLLLAGCLTEQPATPTVGDCAFAPDIAGCKQELAQREAAAQATEDAASGREPADARVSLTSSGAIRENGDGTQTKFYTIASATPGLLISHILLKINADQIPCGDTAPYYSVSEGPQTFPCDSDRQLTPGDTLTITAPGPLSGKSLTLYGEQSGRKLISLTMG